MKPDGYWCPQCGDLTLDMRALSDSASDHCQEVAIPRFVPLAVPEVTTWGESGGGSAVCCEHMGCSDGGGVLDYGLGDDVWREHAISIYDSGEILIHDPVDGRFATFAYARCQRVVDAMNFLEQSKNERA